MITHPTIASTIIEHPGRVMMLCDIDWPSGHIYAHNRGGEKRWDGKTWLGVGNFASFGTFTQGDRTGQLSLSLQVVNPDLVNESIKDDAVGREVKCYMAATDETRRIIAAQLIAYKLIAEPNIDYSNIPVINLRCGSHRERHKSAKAYNRLTKNAWRDKYPNDSYCDDVEVISKGPLSSYSGAQAVGSGRLPNRRGGHRP